MILQDIQAFIYDHHLVSLTDLEMHFGMDGQVIQSMLLKLIRKGRVRQVPIPEKCHGCTSCSVQMLTFYEWADEQQRCESSQLCQRFIPCCQKQPVTHISSCH